VITKTDKLKLMKRTEAVKRLRKEIGDGFGKPIVTSSEKGDGLDVVWKTCFENAYPDRLKKVSAATAGSPESVPAPEDD